MCGHFFACGRFSWGEGSCFGVWEVFPACGRFVKHVEGFLWSRVMMMMKLMMMQMMMMMISDDDDGDDQTPGRSRVTMMVMMTPSVTR